MHLAMPMNKSTPVILMPGSTFYGRILAHGAIWQFTSTFIDKTILPVPIWISGPPYDLKKVQLRSFVRLPVTLPLTLSIPSDETDEAPVGTTTRDLSGGGLQLILKKRLPVGTILRLTLQIPGFSPVAATATVVRVEQPPDTNIFWIAVKFSQITEKDREKIIKFIFKKQCELRQKGL